MRDCANSSAWLRFSLEDDGIKTCEAELVSGRQPGDATADHGNVHTPFSHGSLFPATSVGIRRAQLIERNYATYFRSEFRRSGIVDLTGGDCFEGQEGITRFRCAERKNTVVINTESIVKLDRAVPVQRALEPLQCRNGLALKNTREFLYATRDWAPRIERELNLILACLKHYAVDVTP